MKTYTEESRVKSYHVDKKGKLSTIQVFNLLQEAAFRHSVIDNFGQPDLTELNLVWMLSRMKVVFLEPALLGEKVEIKSWVRSIKGALSERDYLLTSGDKIIANATSLWACLSVNPVKPIAIPPQIAERMHIYKEFSNDFSTSKINSINKEFTSNEYVVQPSDIDMVNHTNNVAYVRMVLDTIGLASKLEQTDVNYLLQSFEGDELKINSQTLDNQSQLHEIVNVEAKVVCRLKTTYK
jgi:acyl-ACP thioesterase